MLFFYNEHQEYELECKRKDTYITESLYLMVYAFLMYVHFEMYVMFKRNPRKFLFFCVLNALSLVYIGDKSGGNDMKAIGDVATFTLKCKMCFLLLILIMKFI